MKLSSSSFVLLSFLVACSSDTTKKPASESDLAARNETGCPELVQPPPDFCDGGAYSPTYEGQCIVGFACSDDAAECPELVQPPPSFCDGGKYSPTYEGKCVVGFTCGS